MFVNKAAHARAKTIKEDLAAAVVAAVEDSGKSTWAISQKAGITQQDLEQVLGPESDGSYPQHQASMTVETAEAILAGLDDEYELALAPAGGGE